MSEVLNKATVLVLNRNWQPIHVRTPADAFCMMFAQTATALDIDEDNYMAPTKWEDWIKLPIRPDDEAVQTIHGPVRAPKVIIVGRYAKMPRRKPSLSSKAIWERDECTCQYTGRRLKPSEGSIDHIVPRSRGGKTSWENCVLTSKEVNARKGNRLPQEAGLKLLRKPSAPPELPVMMLIRNPHKISDWDHFLLKG